MNNNTEQQVIGGLLHLGNLQTDQAQRALVKLKPAAFVSNNDKVIFEAIQRLSDAGSEIDPFIVENECKKDKRYEPEMFEYLCDIAANIASAANLHIYTDQLIEKSVQRFASQKLNEAILIINSNGNVGENIGLVESMMNQIITRFQKTHKGGLKHVGEISKQWAEEVNERLENGDSGGYTLGIEALDNILLPKRIPKGSLVVVGARPKIGKTSVMGSIIQHFAIDRKEAVATFSLEMPEIQMYERLIIGKSGVDPKILYTKSDNPDFGAVESAMSAFMNTNLYIDDTPGITLAHLKREVRKLHKKHNVGLIAVDYLTLMEAEKADRNDLGYGMITKGLKNLAKELNCVVLLLTQLNRKLEDRADKRPMPSDSRDTGQIEQDCDLWIGLYRDAVYNQNFEHKGLTELIVRLNRHGDTGTAYANMEHGAMQPIDQALAQEWAEGTNQKIRRPQF